MGYLILIVKKLNRFNFKRDSQSLPLPGRISAGIAVAGIAGIRQEFRRNFIEQF